MKLLALTSVVVLALSCAPSAVAPSDSSGEQREVPGTTYQLTIAVVGMGHVAADSPGPVYDAGSQAALRATPVDGWRFGEWSGDAEGTDRSAELTMDRDRTITATFIQQCRLTINVVGKGQVSADPPGPVYDAGSKIGLRAVPTASDWTFDHWEGAVTGTATDTSFTINAASEVTAIFDAPVPRPNLDGDWQLAVTFGNGKVCLSIQADRIVKWDDGCSWSIIDANLQQHIADANAGYTECVSIWQDAADRMGIPMSAGALESCAKDRDELIQQANAEADLAKLAAYNVICPPFDFVGGIIVWNVRVSGSSQFTLALTAQGQGLVGKMGLAGTTDYLDVTLTRADAP